MTRRNVETKMAMCRRCGHDLYVIRNGPNQGEVRCSNRTCRFARQTYVMGKNTNEGVAA